MSELFEIAYIAWKLRLVELWFAGLLIYVVLEWRSKDEQDF